MRIAFNETTELQLKHPVTGQDLINSKDKPMIAVIFGKHTSAFQDVMDAMKENQEKDLTPQETRIEAVKLLSKCVKEFKNIEIETENGAVDGKDNQSCLGVFWIKEQVDSGVMDKELFLQPSNES